MGRIICCNHTVWFISDKVHGSWGSIYTEVTTTIMLINVRRMDEEALPRRIMYVIPTGQQGDQKHVGGRKLERMREC
jgi:hypothetical protein